MRIKLLLLSLALLAAAIVLTACGGGSSGGSSSSGSGSSSGSTAEGSAEITDWPVFGRDRDNTRFATQDEVNTDNVGELGEAWSTGVGPDQYLMESYPLVIGENIYVTTSTDEVMSINGKTGHINWTYTPEVDFSQSTGVGGYGISVNRGIAAEDGKLFLLTFDNKLQALSQQTGERLWSSEVEDPATGAYESMAPTAYDGKVYVGVSGSEDGVRGKISAYDQKSGKELWTFHTVPKAGTGWVPKGGGGGTIYMPPTIDPETNTVYVGTGNPAPVLVGAKRPGKNLYTDSILALDAETGKLKWYHQERHPRTEGERHRCDWAPSSRRNYSRCQGAPASLAAERCMGCWFCSSSVSPIGRWRRFTNPPARSRSMRSPGLARRSSPPSPRCRVLSFSC